MPLELHPLCTLFPPLDGDAFDALVADIRAHGQREPIVVHDGMILDGDNRYRACLAAGVEPTTRDFGDGNLVAFVLSANLHRRHMTVGQQAAIVAAAQDWAKAQPAQRPGKQTLNVCLSTRADRAALSGASLPTQRDADRIVRADPELGKQVARGEVSLTKAVKKIDAAKAKADQWANSPKPAHVPDDIKPEDAYDANFDPLVELERAQKEIEALQVQIEALSKSDVTAELARQVAIRQGIETQLSREMTKNASLDKELRKFGRFFDDLCKATGKQTRTEILAHVRERLAA